MAKRTPEPAPANLEVSYERKDITAGSVFEYGIYLAGGIVVVVVSMLWYGQVLQAQHRKPDPLKLPTASTDNQLPPEPRLEAQEDLDIRKPRMFPPRAAEYYAPQREQLEKGNGTILKIETAMETVSRSLPVRKGKHEAAPTDFTIRLPSKSSAGRAETGGQ